MNETILRCDISIKVKEVGAELNNPDVYIVYIKILAKIQMASIFIFIYIYSVFFFAIKIQYDFGKTVFD